MLLMLVMLMSVVSSATSIYVCPGESVRYGNRKCNHDPTHRVCAKLFNRTGQPLMWGNGNFWTITEGKMFRWLQSSCGPRSAEAYLGQPSLRDTETDIAAELTTGWDDQIRGRWPSGTDWCVCMRAIAKLVVIVGCKNVHIDCGATDITHVMREYEDGGVDLAPAKKCLKKKCCPPQGACEDASGWKESDQYLLATPQLSDASVPVVVKGIRSNSFLTTSMLSGFAAGAALVVGAYVLISKTWKWTNAAAETAPCDDTTSEAME
eukprot:gnl/TRDRNA2_/TRDRNA2_204386_c0_seq1.p1 gnl/TRDRNA2_/TRDRNA2_204386_c0~~gnl/TRDRNA2_/TRDRNA2_204386_c0_seq1.p1  ORF type:complete len:264 (-),score=40.06 gnl/TRDRNA2_/TRDRNA2_204386_c0_seq1:158-949(-)